MSHLSAPARLASHDDGRQSCAWAIDGGRASPRLAQAAGTRLLCAGPLASTSLHLIVLAALARLVLPALPPSWPDAAVTMVFAPAAPAVSPQAGPSLPAALAGPRPEDAPAVLRPAPLRRPVRPLRPMSPAAGRRARTALPHSAALRPGPAASSAAVGAPAAAPTPSPAPSDPEAPNASSAFGQQPASGNPPASPSATPPPPHDPAWLAAFEARVQAAVQKAATYPPAARLAHMQGRVRVSFDYASGAITGSQVLVGSRTAMLDRAALRAVASASLPAAPPALRGSVRLVVWVDFRLTPES